jgi:TetR/AcrR family transcriptional regulator, tetracycline repressor protein
LALDRQQVVNAAVQLLDEDGLDALSFRTLARRLGVQAPTLYWHIGSKAELLDALADIIMDDAIQAIPKSNPDDDWAEWMLTVLLELRTAMLLHRDGARVVSGARLSLRRGDFSEATMSILVSHGIELQRARFLTLAGERFTFGYVLEEQAPTDATQQAPAVEELQARFPTMVQAIGQYFSAGHTSDDLFQDIVRVMLGMSQKR